MTKCERSHEPNELTALVIREMQAKQVVQALLKHAVYDREKNDECVAAVEAAEGWLASDY